MHPKLVFVSTPINDNSTCDYTIVEQNGQVLTGTIDARDLSVILKTKGNVAVTEGKTLRQAG
jgi:hypothetical protein